MVKSRVNRESDDDVQEIVFLKLCHERTAKGYVVVDHCWTADCHLGDVRRSGGVVDTTGGHSTVNIIGHFTAFDPIGNKSTSPTG